MKHIPLFPTKNQSQKAENRVVNSALSSWVVSVACVRHSASSPRDVKVTDNTLGFRGLGFRVLAK